jgi:lipoprotein-releasing system permease protein
MDLKLFIARRYLFSRKTKNVINIISGISLTGVAVGTAALIVVLSVFNGFDGLIRSLFNTFDPELKITPAEGKTFNPSTTAFDQIRNHEKVIHFTEVLEENVLLKYDEKLHPATIKGVTDEFINTSGIDSMIVQGDFILESKGSPMAVVGQGVAYYLSIGLGFINPILVYVPKRGKNAALRAENAFNQKAIYPSGIFSIQQDFDTRYIITPISFVRDLLNYNDEVSAIELKLGENANIETIKKELKSILGEDFFVKDRYEQHEFFYKIMRSEKWAIFLILSFILLIASFNIIGSITMLIIDKKNDILTLNSLGANERTIRNIFVYEGWFISALGAFIGLILGGLICWAQIHFELIRLEGSGSFIIDAYPVSFEALDFVYVFIIVLLIGFIAAWFPSRTVLRKFLVSQL